MRDSIFLQDVDGLFKRFEALIEAGNGDGLTLISKDGGSEIRAFGSFVRSNDDGAEMNLIENLYDLNLNNPFDLRSHKEVVIGEVLSGELTFLLLDLENQQELSVVATLNRRELDLLKIISEAVARLHYEAPN